MISRGSLAERGAIIAGCIITPALVAFFLPFDSDWIRYGKRLLLTLGLALPLGAAIGFAATWFGFVRWQRRQSVWTTSEEAAALMKQCAVELVTGNAVPALLEAAQKAGQKQEGRVAALYLAERIEQLRREQPAPAAAAAANPVPWKKRLAWGSGLLLSSLTLALLPVFTRLGIPVPAALVVAVLLLPLWVTGIFVSVAGQAGADWWLNAIDLSKLIKQREFKPKLRKPTITTVAGSWHTRRSAHDVPIFRGLLAIILIISTGLYFLREYTADYFLAPTSEAPLPDSAPAPPTTAATPRPTTPPRRVTATPVPTPRVAPPPSDRPQAWNRLEAGGALLEADEQRLRYAGWDIAHIRSVLTEAKPRLDQWHAEQLRDNPRLSGRISFELVLQPYGRISRSTIIASEFDNETFVNGLLDRLDALDFGSGAFDPVTLVLSVDFRP